jgi:hypothetical protein
MSICKRVEQGVTEWAALAAEAVPAWVREHLEACGDCRRLVEAVRVARCLVSARAVPVAPPEGFAGRVVAALPRRAVLRPAESDLWRPAWGLIPTFAAMLAGLIIMYQATEMPGPMGLLLTEGLSAGEALVLEASAPEADQVLSAVLEDTGR